MDWDGNAVGGSAMNEREIGERIALIESMMREGRRRTEYWGWNFLLWGVAYLIAIGWSSFFPAGRALAWPVTMILAALLTIGIARRRMHNQPRTEKSRGIQAIWTAVGSGIFVFAFPVAFSGHFQAQSFMAAIETLLGVAYVGSGLTLRWTTQIVLGALWWVAAIASCFVRTENGVGIIFLAATFVCMIGFGIYLMIRESRVKAQARAAGVQHA
ncbi:MAG TPA: hypothetical protein VGG85_03500 [Terracidiphilus sp.]